MLYSKKKKGKPMVDKTFDSQKIRDLYKHRWALNYGDTAKKETPEFWNERAGDFAAKAHSIAARKESEEFLNRFSWSTTETVLDVATGPGTFAIPLARRVAKIVATDFSKAMLEQLELKAQDEQVDNIEIIQGRWLEIEDPKPCDTVLCLNSLGVISTDAEHKTRLEETLQKLARSCKKRLILLLPHADSPVEPDLRRQLGLGEIALERRRVAILYLAMIENGMLPSLHIIKRPFHWTFTDIHDASETLLLKAGVKNVKTHQLLMEDYLRPRLHKEEDGRFSLAYEVSQALYIWEK
jgi:SAM-dependent methyltransferase